MQTKVEEYEMHIGEVINGRKIIGVVTRESENGARKSKYKYCAYELVCETCGRHTFARSNELKRIAKSDCMCARTEKLKTHIGEVHGMKRILGLEEISTSYYQVRRLYKCECIECGRITYTVPSLLLNDRESVMSCRCKQGESRFGK